VRELVEKSSYRQAEEVTGVSVGSIRSLLDGGTPIEATLELLETWAVRAGLTPSVAPETAPKVPWLPTIEIGKKIEGIRKRAGKSQAQLAEYLGMPKGQAEVSRWERGHQRPSFERLTQIAALEGKGAEIFQAGIRFTPKSQLIVREPEAALYSPPFPEFMVPSTLVRHIIRFLVADLGYSKSQLQLSPGGGDLTVLSTAGRTLLEVKAPRFSQQGVGRARDQEDQAKTPDRPDPLPDSDPRHHSAAESDEAVSISESIPPAPAPEVRPAQVEQGVPRTSKTGTTSKRRKL
jgi:transcriptional regulator with XRE-family HTH domain